MLVISLLSGVIGRQLGLAICAGLALSDEMYDELETPEGMSALQRVAASREEFKNELSSAFLPPLRGMMKRSFERGGIDPLSAEKRLTKLFSIQIYSLWIQGSLGAAGLLVFGLGIK